MLTRTMDSPEKDIQETPLSIREKVQERGFYLYEWISPDELRMTLDRDYLQTVKTASMPLAIVTGIAGLIGYGGGPVGSMIAIIGVLGVFYLIVGIILFIRFLHRSYLYTRGANVVITDEYYVTLGRVVEQGDTAGMERQFSRFESIFEEKFMGESKLAEKKAKAKTELFENLKEVASGGGKILQNVSRSRDSGGIVIIILVAGFLYAAMMGIVYYIGIAFIALFGRIFTGLAHRYLLMMNNQEHQIQDLFRRIDTTSKRLAIEQVEAINLLDEAKDNAWQENLLGKINASIEYLATLGASATEDTTKLRSRIESSRYKNLFNFGTYGSWVKKQILEPIRSILSLLKNNNATLKSTIDALESQISETSDPGLKNPLILQKERLEVQSDNFERLIRVFEEYIAKLS